MSLPDFREINTGDINDDDPRVLDDLVQQQANPVPPLPDVMTFPVAERPKRVTQLQTGQQTILATWDPYRILPPDADRKSVVIAMNSASATDSVFVGGTADSAKFGGSLFQANPLSLTDHTGAVWVYNPTANPVTVSWWAVTI